MKPEIVGLLGTKFNNGTVHAVSDGLREAAMGNQLGQIRLVRGFSNAYVQHKKGAVRAESEQADRIVRLSMQSNP